MSAPNCRLLRLLMGSARAIGVRFFTSDDGVIQSLGRIEDLTRDLNTMSGCGIEFTVIVQGLDQPKDILRCDIRHHPVQLRLKMVVDTFRSRVTVVCDLD